MISVKDAAKLLNTSPQTVRIGLQRGLFPFGTAIKTSSKYTYFIYKKKLNEYVEISERGREREASLTDTAE